MLDVGTQGSKTGLVWSNLTFLTLYYSPRGCYTTSLIHPSTFFYASSAFYVVFTLQWMHQRVSIPRHIWHTVWGSQGSNHQPFWSAADLVYLLSYSHVSHCADTQCLHSVLTPLLEIIHWLPYLQCQRGHSRTGLLDSEMLKRGESRKGVDEQSAVVGKWSLDHSSHPHSDFTSG